MARRARHVTRKPTRVLHKLRRTSRPRHCGLVRTAHKVHTAQYQQPQTIQLNPKVEHADTTAFYVCDLPASVASATVQAHVSDHIQRHQVRLIARAVSSVLEDTMDYMPLAPLHLWQNIQNAQMTTVAQPTQTMISIQSPQIQHHLVPPPANQLSNVQYPPSNHIPLSLAFYQWNDIHFRWHDRYILTDPCMDERSPYWRDYPEYLPPRQAYELLHAILDRPPTRLTPAHLAQHFLEYWYNLGQEHQTQDSLLDCFTPLDILLFDGALCRRVFVEWTKVAPGERMALAQTNGARLRDLNDCARIRIQLDIDRAWYHPVYSATVDGVLGTLIHEMIHAYIELYLHKMPAQWRFSSVWVKELCTSCGRYDHHGPLFLIAVAKVVRRLSFLPGMGDCSITDEACCEGEEEDGEEKVEEGRMRRGMKKRRRGD